MRLLAFALVTCLACGCSLVFTGDEYVFGDAGPMDGASDGMVGDGTVGDSANDGSSDTSIGTCDCECGFDECIDGTCVPAATVQSALGVGTEHGCAITPDGVVYCWGEQSAFDLTSGGVLPMPVGPPVQMVSGSVGDALTCIVGTAGETYCWGRRDGPSMLDIARSPNEEPLATRFDFVDVGAEHVCGVTRDAEVFCWGDNDRGQLGSAPSPGSSTPSYVATMLNARQVAVGRAFSCAVLTSGIVECWGANDQGQLGNGSTLDRPSPGAVSDLNAGWICAGDEFACAIRDDARVVCWGANDRGQLGNGGTTDSATPTLLGSSEEFEDLACGAQHACGVTAGGGVVCWGDGSRGQLGRADPGPSSVPLVVATPPSISRWASVRIGGPLSYTSCATTDRPGALYCWGDNRLGQVLAEAPVEIVTPTRVCVPPDAL